jgi:hypothetical protein
LREHVEADHGVYAPAGEPGDIAREGGRITADVDEA